MVTKLEEVEIVKLGRKFLARVIVEIEWVFCVATEPGIKEVTILLEHYFIKESHTQHIHCHFENSLSEHVRLRNSQIAA